MCGAGGLPFCSLLAWMVAVCSLCDTSVGGRCNIGVLFCMSCYSSTTKFKNQGPLPTQQRVALISVADEVCHTKHAEEKKRKDVRVRRGKYREQECFILSSQKVSFSIYNTNPSPDSRVADTRGRRKEKFLPGNRESKQLMKSLSHRAWYSVQ